SNPVTFNGSITTNGPVMVTYHWEASGDAQETLPDTTLNFAQAGTQKVTTDVFSADCGEYAVTLRGTVPEETSARQAFNIQAP
ncbi:MAG: hypothetical protein WBL25_16390, partial [Anaerolineales bacterium]